ncbi:MAG: ATP-binding cassette domain-containing protein, partial [Pseudomonadota bacterium]
MRDTVLHSTAPSTETTPPQLVTDGLRLEDGAHCLINNVTLRLEGDGITVVMGPNGAGKSVFLRLLHGLISPSAGRILWRGEPLTPEVTCQHSLVFQKPVLLRRSVAANIDFILRARGLPKEDLRWDALRRVGLLDKVDHPARRLSGGEQQRLALARALVTSPELLMLDEPTANLDPGATQMIERIVKDTAEQGTKVVFVTHDVGQARRLASDVVFLQKGQLAEHSPADLFFDSPQTNTPVRPHSWGYR